VSHPHDTHADQSASPGRPQKARKPATPSQKKPRKAAKEIEYIKVPKHWFAEPLNSIMKKVVRPPTKRSRRKELEINLRIPMEIFVDLMKPMDTGDMEKFEWEDAQKTKLKPTKETKGLQHFSYMISKPEKVDKFWRLQEREPVRRKRKDGALVPYRRGLGSSRLHLSSAAEERGERTDLLAQVTGNVTVALKVPTKERAMPYLKMGLKVSTLNKFGHTEWGTAFGARTAAALRKQMEHHLRTMVEDPLYPTLTQGAAGMLMGPGTNSVRPLALPPLALPPPRQEPQSA
jgi:hypothetical protein